MFVGKKDRDIRVSDAAYKKTTHMNKVDRVSIKLFVDCIVNTKIIQR